MSTQNPTDRPSLFLLDGYALIYRAFFAMISRPLTTSSGENTSAPYGIARFLLRLIEDHKPEYLGVVFDAGDSFRTELFPEYKATREKMPDELRASLPRCREIFEAFRVPVIEAEGWEADDVIGTLADRAAEAGLHTVIVSGDKDFHQLVDENTALLNPGRGGPAGVEQEWVSLDNAEERFGVPPDRVTDYLALLGDSSDNVPGVPGIGKKTAPTLIHEFGDLEAILARADEVSGTRARNALQQHAEEARLSKQLVTIRLDAPVDLELGRLERDPPDRERLNAVFLELEFHNLLREVEPVRGSGAGDVPESLSGAEYELVETPERACEIAVGMAQSEAVSVYVLGTSDDALRADLVGIGLSAEPGKAYYLPLGHRPPEVVRDSQGNPTLGLDAQEVENLPALSRPEMAAVRTLLESECAMVGYDLKYAVQLLGRFGVQVGGLAFDTSIGSYCLDPARRDASLALLVMDRFSTEILTLRELGGTGRSATPLDQVTREAARTHACEHADYALRFLVPQRDELRAHGMEELFESIEMPLLPVLASMERVGIAIDLDFFERLRVKLRGELELVAEEIRKVAGEEVNLRSVPQLRELLFEKLELPVVKRTKTGPSTDESVLEQLAAMGHAIPRLILEHRELDKLDSTYVSKLPQLVSPEDGRIHTRFNQTVTATGRLSSSDPNLQNIPIRSLLGREIRKGFVPAPGHFFVGADYSQVELRVLAHLSHDPAFLEAFGEDRDIHRETAARIFGVDSDRVTPGMRDQAKTINFATIYGQGPVALAAQLGISRSEARHFIDRYFERFSGVAEYLEEMKEQAREKGYVETLIGRRRYIPEIRSRNPGIRGFGERTATNSPIQGTAADLIKIAMIRLDRSLADTDARMLLQVHDELLVEVPEQDVDEVGELIRVEMEGAIDLSVPLKVDLGIGSTWYDTKFD
jgi:DNA polymerase-1